MESHCQATRKDVKSSFLSLNEDCLAEVLACIDDYRAFYSFSLTCKCFYEVSVYPQRWHINIIKRKIRFFGTRFVISEFPKDRKYYSNIPLVGDLVRIADIYKATKPTLDNVMNVWKTMGPVACTVFTWIKDMKLRHEYNDMGMLEHVFKKIMIYLPYLSTLPNKQLTIDVHFDLQTKRLIMMYTVLPAIKQPVKVMFSSRDCNVMYFHSHFYQSLSTDELNRVCEHLQPIIDVLQSELGDTNPCIGVEFLMWLSFYPESLEWQSTRNAVIMKDKIFFHDSAKNEEPTEQSDYIRTACEWMSQNNSLMAIIGESENVEVIKMTIPFLNKGSKYKIMKKLSKEMVFILSSAAYLTSIVSERDLLNVVMRISFLSNTFSKIHESEVTNFHFRAKGEKTLKMSKFGLPFGKFCSKWYFSLDDQEIHWEVGEFSAWMDPNTLKKGQGPFDKLQPITDLFEECINGRLGHVQLTNHFTDRLLNACMTYQYCDKLYYN